MRSSLLLAAVPLAAALPHGQPEGVPVQVTRLEARAMPPHIISSVVSGDDFDRETKVKDLRVNMTILGANEASERTPTQIQQLSQADLRELVVADLPEGLSLHVGQFSPSDTEAPDELEEDLEEGLEEGLEGGLEEELEEDPEEDPLQTLENPPQALDAPVPAPTKAAPGSPASGDIEDIIRPEALREHNGVRNGRDLEWNENLYEKCLEVAKRCNDQHSQLVVPSDATRTAENITPILGDAASDVETVLQEAFTEWHHRERRWLNPAEPHAILSERNLTLSIEGGDSVDRKRPGTVGHAANIIDPAFTRFAVAAHYCASTPAPVVNKSPGMVIPMGYWSLVAQFDDGPARGQAAPRRKSI